MAITKTLLDDLAAEYLELEKVVDLNNKRMAEIKATVRKNVEPGEHVLPQGKIVYSRFVKRVFNKKLFADSHPDLHEQYLEEKEATRLEIKA